MNETRTSLCDVSDSEKFRSEFRSMTAATSLPDALDMSEIIIKALQFGRRLGVSEMIRQNEMSR